MSGLDFTKESLPTPSWCTRDSDRSERNFDVASGSSSGRRPILATHLTLGERSTLPSSRVRSSCFQPTPRRLRKSERCAAAPNPLHQERGAALRLPARRLCLRAVILHAASLMTASDGPPLSRICRRHRDVEHNFRHATKKVSKSEIQSNSLYFSSSATLLRRLAEARCKRDSLCDAPYFRP